MRFIIYEIRHVSTNKIYIGKHQTDDIDDNYMGSGKLIRRAIKKYGSTAFVKTILFEFSSEAEMNAKEKEIVTEEFCHRKDTYNICPGGQGGFGYINTSGIADPRKGGISHSNKHMKALSQLGRKKFKDILNTESGLLAFKQAIKKGQENKPNVWLGKKHTQETKEKISKSNTGKCVGEKNGRYGTRWITNGTENKCISSHDSIPAGWRLGRVMPRLSIS